jgi:cell division protein FtsA
VVNIESTVQSIQRAVEEAELMAEHARSSTVYAGIAGSHVSQPELAWHRRDQASAR